VDLFLHHIYELKKGLRGLILHTTHSENKKYIENKLIRLKISYLIDDISDTKINVFFGHKGCIDVIKSFSSRNLSKITHEEDFILAAMLGYDIRMQCERYIKRKNTFALLEGV
jgi:hypothetical protein